MIIHDNGLPIKIIGHPESTSVLECFNFFKKETKVEIINFDRFMSMYRKDYQFTVPFFLDMAQRQRVIEKIREENLNCPSYVHDSCILWDDPNKILGRGCLLAHFVTMYQDSYVSDHSVIESYSMIGHYSTVGESVHMAPGVMIAGSTKIGDHCYFGMRSTVMKGLTLCDNVEVGAVSAITKNIDQPGRYVGTPARKIQNYQENI